MRHECEWNYSKGQCPVESNKNCQPDCEIRMSDFSSLLHLAIDMVLDAVGAVTSQKQRRICASLDDVSNRSLDLVLEVEPVV
jgi:hypothetical protein